MRAPAAPPPPTPPQRNKLDFKTPTALYTTVTASVVDTDSTDTSSYQAFADVTSLVQAGGSGTYSAGDIQAGTGENRYGGWALVVAYGDTTEPFQRIHVYDGFQVLQSGGTTTTDITSPTSSRLRPARSMAASASSPGRATAR